MGRAELFIWLACVLLAKQFFPAWNSASSFVDALVAECTNRNAFYYLAWYAVFRLLYESNWTAPATTMDVAYALLIASLNFLSATSISWISATAVGVFLLATSQEDRKFQAAATVLFALAFNGLWGPLIFDVFAIQLLQADAILVGALLSATQPGMSWSQTIVGAPEHSVLIFGPCSSFHNISLGLLCWVTVTKLMRTAWVLKDVLVALVVCTIVVLLNGSRLYLMALSPDYFTYWHDGLGQQLFVWATLLGVLLISLAGAIRFERAK